VPSSASQRHLAARGLGFKEHHSWDAPPRLGIELGLVRSLVAAPRALVDRPLAAALLSGKPRQPAALELDPEAEANWGSSP
jgi:hypothetical protein